MADTLNLAAESGRNIIGDDSSPTLTLENTSSGNTLKLQNAGGTGTSLSIISCPTVSLKIASGGAGAEVESAVENYFKSSVTEQHALVIEHTTAIASPTVAPLKLGTSAASGAVIEFDIGLVSNASIATMAGAVPVRLKGEDKIAYIPIYEIS